MRTRRIVTSMAAAMALAPWCTQVQAQSTSVQFYGLIGSYVGTTKVSGAPSSTTVVNGGGLTTSFFGFRARKTWEAAPAPSSRWKASSSPTAACTAALRSIRCSRAMPSSG